MENLDSLPELRKAALLGPRKRGMFIISSTNKDIVREKKIFSGNLLPSMSEVLPEKHPVVVLHMYSPTLASSSSPAFLINDNFLNSSRENIFKESVETSRMQQLKNKQKKFEEFGILVGFGDSLIFADKTPS